MVGKVTMVEDSPSAQVVAKANIEAVIVDPQGRSITLKKPGVLAQFKLIELLGASASNESFVGMVLPLMYVSAIDGDLVSRFTTRLQLDALITRLDEDGVVAVAAGVVANFGRSATPDETATAIKN